MMTKMSSMSPEGLLMAGGLTKDRRLMRVEKLLGLTPSPQQNPPSDAGDFSEEDIWGACSDETKRDESFRQKTESGAEQQQTGRILQNGRRWLGLERDGGGLSVAFEESNRSRLSPLKRRTSNTFNNGTPPSRISVRMVPPQIGGTPGDLARHPMRQSAPVNVPEWSKILGVDPPRSGNSKFISAVQEAEEEEEEEGEKLPPHLYLAREQARSQRATKSVFEGVGRTLKGRDMSRVRNAVWRQTGFLG